jgi:hypothetical protein
MPAPPSINGMDRNRAQSLPSWCVEQAARKGGFFLSMGMEPFIKHKRLYPKWLQEAFHHEKIIHLKVMLNIAFFSFSGGVWWSRSA